MGGRVCGRVAKTPREAVEGADFVFACVGNDDDLRQVTTGPEGAFHGMSHGAVFVDHTTASATVARELGRRRKGKGWALSMRRSPAGRQGPRTACSP